MPQQPLTTFSTIEKHKQGQKYREFRLTAHYHKQSTIIKISHKNSKYGMHFKYEQCR